MQIDIETKYVMNFTNSSSILYDKGNELYIIYYESCHFYRKCETDYFYQKKILKDINQVMIGGLKTDGMLKEEKVIKILLQKSL